MQRRSKRSLASFTVASITLSVLALTAVATSASAQSDDHSHGVTLASTSRPARVGHVHFENTGAASAQPSFERGIALLHSFMYDEAAESFREAQRRDPSFAMAYWGEALTYIHTGWRTENVPAATHALEHLAPTPAERLAKAKSPREREYGAAVEALVEQGAPEAKRFRAFTDSMRAIHAHFPNDVDATAFAALGGLTANHVWPLADPAAQAAELDDAERMATDVFEHHPDHPAGAHYLIHADDDPVRAPRALKAARAYARIAPDADHAQHMPSHVFVQLGYWDDATASNERAWSASRVARGGGASYHSLEWLQYSYLQQGRVARAAALVDSGRVAAGEATAAGDADARYAVQDLAFRLAAESGRGWNAVRDAARAALGDGAAPATPREGSFALAAGYHLAVAQANTGDTASARRRAQDLHRAAEAMPAAAAGRALRETYAFQLEGIIAKAAGDLPGAIAAFQHASDAEDRVSPIGPPPFIPSAELLGGTQLAAGHSSDAVASFSHSLERRPNRTGALLGLARAQRAAGDVKGAAATLAKLRTDWHRADSDLLRTIPR